MFLLKKNKNLLGWFQKLVLGQHICTRCGGWQIVV
jgi:hypothetical protein